MTTRIYVVEDDRVDGDAPRLIWAASPAQAIRHAIKGRFTAKLASQSVLAALLTRPGMRVEEAGKEGED